MGSPNLYPVLKKIDSSNIASIGMENFLLPEEIVLKILGYLSLSELIQCARVSRRFNRICKDRSLSYRSSTLIIKDLTLKDQIWIKNIVKKHEEMKKVIIDQVSGEGVIETKLSEKMVKMTFLGPKSYRMEKKKKS